MKFSLNLYDFSNDTYGELKTIQQLLKNDEVVKLLNEGAVRLNSAAFYLEYDGNVFLDGNHFFGQLNLLLLQLRNVVERLEENKIALLRAANLNIDEGPFLSFEPDRNHVIVSYFFIEDTDFSCVFPIDGVSGGNSEKLYNYFSSKRELILSPKIGTVYFSHFLEYRFPKDELIELIKREVACGERFFHETGIELTSDIFPEQLYE